MALSYITNFSNDLTALKERAWSRIIGPFTEPFSSKENEEKSFGKIVVSSLLVLAAPFIALFGALHTAADALRLGIENAFNKTTDVKLFGLSPTFFIVATALTTVATLFVLANFGLIALSIPALEVAIASLVVLLALNFMSKTKEELKGANESMSYNAKATLGLLTVLAPVVALFLPASPIALIALSLAPLLLTALGLTIGAAFTGKNVFGTLTTDLFGVKKDEENVAPSADPATTAPKQEAAAPKREEDANAAPEQQAAATVAPEQQAVATVAPEQQAVAPKQAADANAAPEQQAADPAPTATVAPEQQAADPAPTANVTSNVPSTSLNSVAPRQAADANSVSEGEALSRTYEGDNSEESYTSVISSNSMS